MLNNIRSLDQGKYISSVINFITYNSFSGCFKPNHRRLYSTNSEAIQRLESIKREIGKTLEPILKQNVVDYKKNSKHCLNIER